MAMPCTYEFSRGYGTGAQEALGNWGFSNRVCSAGHELQRLKCLFAKMDSLRKKKSGLCVKYDPRNDPNAWYVKPSPEECKPAWTFPANRPLIVHCPTVTIMKLSNLVELRSNLEPVLPGHVYIHQGTDKWYRGIPNCCYQPSCLAPQCPTRYC